MDAGAGARAVSYVENASQFARNEEERFVAKLVLASAQKRNGNLTRAVALVEEALRMSPENPMAMNNLGFMLLESGGDTERAIGLIRKAVRIDPRNSAYLDSLGLAYIKKGNPDLALEKLRRALVLNPISVATLEHLGDAYLTKGEKGKAVEFWKRASMISWDRLVKERLKGKIDNSAR
jgi:tetratricopeptide (TPR) repeat protein